MKGRLLSGLSSPWVGVDKKFKRYLMEENMVQCKAKSKRSSVQCRNHAVDGKSVCRLHGAFAGPKTSEGIARIKQANTTHGKYTKEAFMEKRAFRQILKDHKKTLSQMDT